jgi:hypothetical protein
MMGMRPFLKKKGAENPSESLEQGDKGQGDDGKWGWSAGNMLVQAGG